LAIPGLQQGFDDFLHRPNLGSASKTPAARAPKPRPVGIFEIKIKEEFGLLAAFLKTGGLFQKAACLGEIALRRYERA